MGEVGAAQVQPGWPAPGGPADTLEIPSPRLGAAHPDPLGDVADNGMQYGRGQPLPPWAAAIPGRHGCRDARGFTFTAAHEVNSRRATQLPATAPARTPYPHLGVTTPFEQRRVRQSPRNPGSAGHEDPR